MKKLLAVIMSVVMAFSIAVVPASAADVTVDEFFEAVDTSIALIEDTINQIHYLVGTILGILEKECPLCGEIHDAELDLDSLLGSEDDAVEDEAVIPEEPTEAAA